MFDPTKDNFTQTFLKGDYYRALPISKDEDLELHLKTGSISCFANNYFDIGLKVWQANVEIQSVFNDIYVSVFLKNCVSIFLKN